MVVNYPRHADYTKRKFNERALNAEKCRNWLGLKGACRELKDRSEGGTGRMHSYEIGGYIRPNVRPDVEKGCGPAAAGRKCFAVLSRCIDDYVYLYIPPDKRTCIFA